ncbi:MAG: DUF6359 domain-containing protein [Nocardioides sp.]|uniref:DUF6359 domain-containing protein n=1 Tax=Nocardioides sp. TaxID=35761 RepID=UPI0039E2397A
MTRSRAPLAGLITSFVLCLTVLVAPPSEAATTLTVTQAMAQQDSTVQTVTGYVVGQPVSSSTVYTSGFTADTAIALSDTAGQTDVSKIIYVQVPSSFRSSFGLQTNPSLMGTQITVTGTLTAYFSHAGIKDGTAFALTSSSTTTTTTVTTNVATGLATQDGSTATITGYIVGQPVSSSTVKTSSFTADTAIAIADTAGETTVSKILYVQVPSAFRSSWGLVTNPGKMGTLVSVTGTLSSYFSHAGIISGTAFVVPSGSTSGGGTSTTCGGCSTAYDSSYYASAIGKTGTALRTSLHAIIKTQTTFTYDNAWTALQALDQDPNNSSNIITIYSRLSLPKTQHGTGVDDWNREHVWAKSHGDFGTVKGPGTDLQMLRPEDMTVNSTRNNLDFDAGGNAVSQCSGCYYDSDSFEPPDASKGEVARIILYMAIRYEGDDGFADLEPNDSVNNGTNPYIGRLSLLLQWNDEFPPTAAEGTRNQLVYTDWQKNRNPFVDHPEWADAIFAA